MNKPIQNKENEILQLLIRTDQMELGISNLLLTQITLVLSFLQFILIHLKIHDSTHILISFLVISVLRLVIRVIEKPLLERLIITLECRQHQLL